MATDDRPRPAPEPGPSLQDLRRWGYDPAEDRGARDAAPPVPRIDAEREPGRVQHLATGEGGAGDWQRSTVGTGQRDARPGDPTALHRSDERIREDIRERLAGDPGLDAADVAVEVTHGRVSLIGTVADAPTKAAIEARVARCDGVTGVDDRLKVVRGPEPGGPPRPHASVPQDSPTARDEARGVTSRPTRDGSGDYG